MKINVHRIITTLFNTKLNEFIARFGEGKIFETMQTGGLMEIKVRNTSTLGRYADWLANFRDELYSKCVDWSLESDSFKEELETLMQFYVNTEHLSRFGVFTNDEKNYLVDQLLKPLEHFFHLLDRELRMTHFSKEICILTSQTPEITIKIVDFHGFPLCQVETQISYVKAPIFGMYSKTIPLCTLRTDSSGTIQMKLPKGHYRIDLEKYGKTWIEGLQEDREITLEPFRGVVTCGKCRKEVTGFLRPKVWQCPRCEKIFCGNCYRQKGILFKKRLCPYCSSELNRLLGSFANPEKEAVEDGNWKCPRCMRINAATARFCTRCGEWRTYETAAIPR